jgi:hypothetical protein
MVLTLYKQVLDIEDPLLCPKFKQKQRKHSMTLRNRLNHFITRSKWLASKPNTKKLQNLHQMTIRDMFNQLNPKCFAKKCVLNRDAYLNGCVLKREVIVH